MKNHGIKCTLTLCVVTTLISLTLGACERSNRHPDLSSSNEKLEHQKNQNLEEKNRVYIESQTQEESQQKTTKIQQKKTDQTGKYRIQVNIPLYDTGTNKFFPENHSEREVEEVIEILEKIERLERLKKRAERNNLEHVRETVEDKLIRTRKRLKELEEQLTPQYIKIEKINEQPTP